MNGCHRATIGPLLALALILTTPGAGWTRSPINADPGNSRLARRTTSVYYHRTSRRYRLPSWGAPRWSTGGAARGGCTFSESPLVPLMPVDDQLAKEPTFFGTTIAAHPVFFAYVPPTTATAVEFLLLDEDGGAVVFEKTVAVTQKPQIVSVSLDPTLPPLKPNTNYRWSFATVCNPQDAARDASGNPYIEGLMQRVDPGPSFAQQLQRTPLRDRPTLYAENGYWLDALAALATLRCNAPTDPTIAADWTTLLQSINLTKLPDLVKLVDPSRIPTAPLGQCRATV